MDETLRKLLDQLPDRAPRSKLEPHAEVIRELRKKRRTYQEIAAFFEAHLQLSVAPSTLHHFVKTRARQARNRTRDVLELPAEPPAKRLPFRLRRRSSPTSVRLSLSPGNIQQLPPKSNRSLNLMPRNRLSCSPNRARNNR